MEMDICRCNQLLKLKHAIGTFDWSGQECMHIKVKNCLFIGQK